MWYTANVPSGVRFPGNFHRKGIHMYERKTHDVVDLKMFSVTQAVNACPLGNEDDVVPLAREIYAFLAEGVPIDGE